MYNLSKMFVVFVFIAMKVNSFRPLYKRVKKLPSPFATLIHSMEEDLPEFLKKKQSIILTGPNHPPPLCYHCKHYIHFTSLNNSTNEKFMESPSYKKYLSFRQDELGTGFGLCKLFGNKLDLIRYSFAKHARENEDQCGKEGRLYEDSYIGFKFKVDTKEDDEEEGEGEKEKEKSKDFIVIPSSTKENENEKKKMNDSHPSTDLEDLKNINSQLYDYSIFLSVKSTKK